ncbi:hypothetical protein LCGC14_0977180 [marine sediment metagenome]|uniref:Uncharacterized protein n=1 Tax=marine sediment metagenome TaxID=412755 RepID=A0A0F9QTA1_9ZZZZ
MNLLASCHLNSKCYDFFNNKIRNELRISTIGIKKKLEPFMDLFW